jgi:hypothetical protein
LTDFVWLVGGTAPKPLKWHRFIILVNATHTKPVHNFPPLQERLILHPRDLRSDAASGVSSAILADFQRANDAATLHRLA